MRALAAALLIALCLAACGGDDDSPPGSGTATAGPGAGLPTIAPELFELGQQRPMRLPAVPTGECPVTPAEAIDDSQPEALGEGPIYITGLGSDSVLHLADGGTATPTADIWQTGQVTFLADSEFAEQKALVRGAGISHAAAIGYGEAPGFPHQPADVFYQLDAGIGPPPPGETFYSWTVDVRIQFPGCFFFQIETEDESQTIIFRVE